MRNLIFKKEKKKEEEEEEEANTQHDQIAPYITFIEYTHIYIYIYTNTRTEPGFEPGGPKHEPKKFQVTWFFF